MIVVCVIGGVGQGVGAWCVCIDGTRRVDDTTTIFWVFCVSSGVYEGGAEVDGCWVVAYEGDGWG